MTRNHLPNLSGFQPRSVEAERFKSDKFDLKKVSYSFLFIIKIALGIAPKYRKESPLRSEDLQRT